MAEEMVTFECVHWVQCLCHTCNSYPSSFVTAEIFLDTIAESSPGWRVILIAAPPDPPQQGDHGIALWVFASC